MARSPLERQVSSLERYEGRGVLVAIVLLCIAPIVILTLAVLNLHAAATQAKLVNTSLKEALTLWLNGPVPEASYSGHLVLALERIDTAVFQLTDAPIALVVMFALWRRRKSARELLALLKASSE